MVPVQLTGGAAIGIGGTPEIMSLYPGIESTYRALPNLVYLGRKTPHATRGKPMLALQDYVDKMKNIPAPDKVDWYTKAAASIARMYLNDTYGDCVIAGKAHALGVWSANDPDSGGLVLATDQEIYSQYQSICGPGDNGCVITDVLDAMVSNGFLAGGKRYPLAGYVSADWTSKELTQKGLAIFGPGCIGINLPGAWTSNGIWDVTNTSIVGGHDVTPAGYGNSVLGTTADGVVICSWGRLYLITWAAWTSRKWLEELYFMVPTKLWTGADGISPSGVDINTLMADLAAIRGGGVPPMPDPNPPTPPTPPVPPVPPVPPTPPAPIAFPAYAGTLALKVPILGTFTGQIQLKPVAAGQMLEAMQFGFSDVLTITLDVFAIVGDYVANDGAKLLADFHKFLRDVGIETASSLQAIPGEIELQAGVSPIVILGDLWAIYAAFKSGNFIAMEAAIAKLIADLRGK